MAQNTDISRYINMTTSYSKLLATTSSTYAIASTSGFYESFHHGILPGDPSNFIRSQPHGQGMFPSSPRIADLNRSLASFPQSGQATFPSPSRITDLSTSSPSFPQYQSPLTIDQSAQYCPPIFGTGTDSSDRNERSSGSENQLPVDRLVRNFQGQAYIPSQPLVGSIPPIPITAKLGVPATKIGSILGCLFFCKIH